jgi:tetratricopeptide (TPR) repeat protein
MLGFGDKGKKIEKLCDQATELYQSGDFDAAEEKIRAGLALAVEAGEKGEPYLLNLRTLLTGVLRSTDRLEEAIEEERNTLRMAADSISGGDWEMHWHLGGLHNNIGQMLAQLSRFDEARPHFVDALRIKKAALAAGEAEAEGDSFREYFDSSERGRIADSVGLTYCDLMAVLRALDDVAGLQEARGEARAFASGECSGEMCFKVAESLLDDSDLPGAEALLSEARDRYYQALRAPEDKLAVVHSPERAMFELFIKKEFAADGKVPTDLFLLELKLGVVRHRLGVEPFDAEALPEVGDSESRVSQKNPIENASRRMRLGIELHLAAQAINERALYDAAETEYRTVIEVFREHLPPDHPAMLEIQSNIDELLGDTGRPPEFAV